MKTIFRTILIAFCFLFAGCVKEIQINDAIEHTFIAQVESGTKTSVDSETGNVLWSVADSISILGPSMNSRFVSRNTQPSKEAVFSGTISNKDNIRFGLYPYSPEASFQDNSVSVLLPAVQLAKAGSFNQNLFISLAKANPSSNKLSFMNLCGGIRFKFSKAGLKKVVFKANNNEKMSGEATAAFSINGKPYVKDVSGASSITLLCDEGFETGVWYYIVAYPVTLSQGFTVIMYSDTEMGTVKVDEKCEIKRSVFASLNNPDSAVKEWKDYSQEPEDFLNSAQCMVYCSDRQIVFPSTEYQYGFSYSDNETWCVSNINNKAISVLVSGDPTVGSTIGVKTKSRNIDSFDASETMSVLKKENNRIWLWSQENSLGFVLFWEDYVPVSEVTLDVNDITLYRGESATLNYEIKPADATNKAIIWLSSNPSVATVSNDGTINAISNGSATVTAQSVDGDIVANCLVSVSGIPVESISFNTLQILMDINESYHLRAIVTPSYADEVGVRWTCSNDAVATVDQEGNVTGMKPGTATIKATTIDGNKTAICDVTICQPAVYTTPEAVDLGLSVKWASFNVGATKPEEFGDYFAWGEINTHYLEESIQSSSPIWKTGKEGYCWNSYKWCDNSSGEEKYTKYYWESDGHGIGGIGQDKHVLDAEDDVASVKFGGKWRIPTYDEYKELFYNDNCKKQWTSINGVWGYKLTSLKYGYTDNWIFFPAAGTVNEESYINYDHGQYWSSNLGHYDNSGLLLSFDSESVTVNYRIGIYRFLGLTVRPVQEK